MKISFFKMSGVGNDYIYLVNPPKTLDLEHFAQVFCRRRFSIGGDGVVVLTSSKTADIKMSIYNSDGTQAQICGNALRCVAKYLFNERNLSEVSIETQNRVVSGKILLNNKQKALIEICIGKAQIIDTELVKFQKKQYEVAFVDVSNPHAVVVVSNFKFDAEKFAKHICKVFGSNINVEFVEIARSGHCKVLVIERGSGRTLGCGSGACAVGCVLSQTHAQKIWNVELEGGKLVVDASDVNNIKMTGEAQFIYHGEVEVD